MNKEKLLNDVVTIVEAKLYKKLNSTQINFIKLQIAQINFEKFADTPISQVITLIVNLIIKKLNNAFSKVEDTVIDVHQILADEIGTNAESTLINQKLSSNTTVDKLLNKPETLQYIFNPKALLKKTYLTLDRKYQAADADNRSEFKWNISDTSKLNMRTSTLTTTLITNIHAIVIKPFKFSNVDFLKTSRNNLSIEIVEFNQQAYYLPSGKKYHFCMDIQDSTDNMFLITDKTHSETKFEFHDTISEINTITLKFGNPEVNLMLDVDNLYGIISAVGVNTLITFTQKHNCVVNNIVQISNYTTSNSNADAQIISTMNNSNGHKITACADTTITIPVDLTTLSGTTTPNSVYVYFDAKRFSINVEVEFMKNIKL